MKSLEELVKETVDWYRDNLKDKELYNKIKKLIESHEFKYLRTESEKPICECVKCKREFFMGANDNPKACEFYKEEFADQMSCDELIIKDIIE